MENDLGAGGRGDSEARLTAAEARAALDGLGSDGAALAERIVTPAWYHPVLGGLVAAVVVGTALPGAASSIVLALGVIGMALLALEYRRRYGVLTTQPAGPRSRRLLAAMVAVMVACMGSSLVVKLAELPVWWMLVPALLAMVLTVVLGRRYDAALRREIRGDGARA